MRIRSFQPGRRHDPVVLSRPCCRFRPGHTLVVTIVRQLAHLIFLEDDVSRSRIPTTLIPLLRLFAIFFAAISNIGG